MYYVASKSECNIVLKAEKLLKKMTTSSWKFRHYTFIHGEISENFEEESSTKVNN